MKNEYAYTELPNPHVTRSREMLKKYPKIKELMGPETTSPFWIVLLTLIQVSVGAYLALNNYSWWIVLAVSWLIGAILNHSLFVFVHESAHDLVAKNKTANRFWGIASNFGQGLPSAISFKTYHLIHHAHMHEYDFDADVAFHAEAKIVGNSWWKKILWFAGFLIVESLRPIKIKKGKVFDAWMIVNIVAVVAFDIFIFKMFGMKALGYLFLSTFFSVGLHPVGARWIQEHYTYKEGQETYSYYGPLNNLNFNIGYHVEHHDFLKIPWSRIKQLKAMAPEYYDNLYSHQSWSKLLLDFIFNPKRHLFQRILRTTERKRDSSKASTGNLNPEPGLGK